MSFFFNTIVGVIIALLLLVVAICITAYRDIFNNRFSKRRIIGIAIFLFCWYILTAILVNFFPELKILSANKTIYGIGSMCVLGVVVLVSYIYE